jgi:ADP-L-glycero-D-manno-heptose 6-epimerase
MIVITGAAGFIGSALVSTLNQMGITDLLLVDDFSAQEKKNNWKNKKYFLTLNRETFLKHYTTYVSDITFVFHLGARTKTLEQDRDVLNKLNLRYSQEIFRICTAHDIPLVYASSAATYGDGQLGYSETVPLIQLMPLNAYAESKHNFDKWIETQEKKPSFWVGLKFFNVFGPNEYHKGRMASVIYHAFNQIQKQGYVELFKSHYFRYKDGEQARDFVYVKDVVSICLFWYQLQERETTPNPKKNGLYNLGSGQARTFLDLTKATFAAMGKAEDIRFIDMPKPMREHYQYFTQADIRKLRDAGYTKRFQSLEQTVEDYVKNYLIPGSYL